MHSEQWKLPAIVYDDAFQDGFLQCTVELLWLEHLWNHVDIMQQLLQCTVELLWLEHLWNHVDIMQQLLQCTVELLWLEHL